jgi:hypothetical protein
MCLEVDANAEISVAAGNRTADILPLTNHSADRFIPKNILFITFLNIRVKFSILIETSWKDLNCGGHQVLRVRSLEKLGETCSKLVERLVDLTGSILKAKSSRQDDTWTSLT